MKALIVDDNMLNLKVAKKMIESIGLETDIVLSGKECLEVVKNNQYNIIFMDIMMPEMDGVETFNKLKEDPNFNIPVITLTADVVNDAKERYLSMGFADYISKPINRGELENIINKYLVD